MAKETDENGNIGYAFTYLKSKIHANAYDISIDISKKYSCRLHNIMKYKASSVIPTSLKNNVYYKISSRASCIVRINNEDDVFDVRTKDLWIEHLINFMNFNKQHVFFIITENLERFIEYDFPKNLLIVTTIRGTKSSKDAEKLALLEYIKYDLGYKTGVFYDNPKDHIRNIDVDIIFCWGSPFVPTSYPFDWLPKNKNIHFMRKVYHKFRKTENIKHGLKLNIWKLF